MENEKYTLITGGSSGLGKEFAIQCAKKGMNIILIALPGSNTSSIATNIAIEFGIKAEVFEFDMTDSKELYKQLKEIVSRFKINFIINNAGVGGTSSITDTSITSIDTIIQLNVRSTVMLIHFMIPHLLKNKKSYIMNIASMAAFTPIAYKTVYPASKAFISSFSLGLKEELSNKGVSVSVIYPGPIMTNSNTTRRIISQGIKGKMGLMPTDKIATVALEKTLAQQSVIIPGMINKINYFLMNFLPLRLKLKLVSKEVKKELKYSVSI